jgi:hypothetical protein
MAAHFQSSSGLTHTSALSVQGSHPSNVRLRQAAHRGKALFFGTHEQDPLQQKRPFTPKKRSWFKTLLLGGGAIISLAIAGKFALNRLSGTLSKQIGDKLGKETAEKLATTPVVENAPTAVQAIIGKIGQGILKTLSSDTATGFIVETVTAVGGQHPAFQLVKPYITKQNLQKVLNPETFTKLWGEISAHNLYSLEAIKTYLRQNAGQLSSVLGDDVTTILKRFTGV